MAKKEFSLKRKKSLVTQDVFRKCGFYTTDVRISGHLSEDADSWSLAQGSGGGDWEFVLLMGVLDPHSLSLGPEVTGE